MKVRFQPQAWVNDYAMNVDPLGADIFEVGDIPENVESDTYESDEYRLHANAPEWVRDWPGPFYIDILRED